MLHLSSQTEPSTGLSADISIYATVIGDTFVYVFSTFQS